MTGLSLSLLGPFQASTGDEPLSSFRTLKVQALLIYLAVERSPGSCQREQLMTLLWPDMPQHSAQSNLRQVLYHLRRAVPPVQADGQEQPIEFLLADHQRVQINPLYPCQVDVLAFKDLLQQAWDHEHADLLTCPECPQRLRQAVELYRGDFLADFYLDDSNEFEEWAAILRESLSRSVLDALETLTEVCIRQKDYRQARSYAEQQLKIDTLQEGAYRQLMMILALSGRHSEALAAYETCRRLLAQELGMAPTARTTNLYEQILAGEISQQEAPLTHVRGYELIDEIGSGSLGTVHRARQVPIGREVAIKVIRPEYANDAEFIRGFDALAQNVANLEHPHIVPLYDYWREPDGAFLVQRLMKGGSLRSALQAGAWPVERVASLLEQIAPALHATHQQGILHRDLTPSNILLDEEGRAYLSDFGIAIDLDESSLRKDSIPDYASPEQILNAPLTPQSDIYSLGLVLYEALTGEKPFGQAALADLLKNHLEEPLPLISAWNPGLPTQVDRVIQRATAKNPSERYADALALAADFHKAIRKEKASTEEISAEPTTAVPGGVNPYKGLRPFREEDAEDFFGRDALVGQLVARLLKSRFLAVVGPSGSGKSSVVSAGLIPALRSGALPGSDKWFITQMTPGTHPLEALELALLKVAVNPPPSLVEPMLKDERGLLRTLRRILPGESNQKLLLVIDQFEELYTLTGDERQREHFIDNLLAAIHAPASPLRVVITLRADFYDRPLAHLPLGALLKEHAEVVLPLARKELEQTIRGPALRARVHLEEGLVAAIAADVSHQPGALPLLQYALTELFEARQNNTLTYQAYQEMDGIAGALGCRAESLFETLDEGQKAAARQLFLRLVTLGEEVEDTRRRVLLSELESLGDLEVRHTPRTGDPEDAEYHWPTIVRRVLDLFGRHRLLTFDRDPLTRGPTVEIAHEMLMTAWIRFQSWIENSRHDLMQQRRLASWVQDWQASGRDPGLLLRAARLDQMAGWAQEASLALTDEEHAFLETSLQARQERQSAEEQRAAHERLLEKRSRNFLGGLVAVLGLATLLALFLSDYAFGQRDLYRQESQARATQQSIAEDQALVIRSRELAGLAQLKLEDDPELGILLALEGLRTNRTVEAENALRMSLHATRLERTLYGHSSVYWLRVSPDGKFLASTGYSFTGGSKVWDITSGRQLFTLPGADITFQMGGEQLVTTDLDVDVTHINQQIWSAENGKSIAQRVVPGLEWSEDARWYYFNQELTRLIVGYVDGRVELWDPISGKRLQSWQAHQAEIFDMAFSPDGRWLATVTTQELKVWDSTNVEELFSFKALVCCVTGSSAVFSPDGRLLAASGDANGEAVIWDVEASIRAGEGQRRLTLLEHSDNINAYAFSADGELLATGGDDGTARVWSLDNGQSLFTLSGHQERVTAVAFTPDGERLVTADRAGDIRIWDLSPSGNREVSTLEVAAFLDLDYSPDGSRFAATSRDGRLLIWSEPGEELLLDIQAHDGYAYEIAFSPDGRQIATSGEDNQVVVWDAQTGVELFAIQGHAEGFMAGFWPNYQAIAYSPDGERLVTGGTDGMVKLWDAANGDEIKLTYPMSLTRGTSPAAVASLAFSPDGRYLAAAGDGEQALVFDSQSGVMILVADTDPVDMAALSFSPDGSKLAIGHWEGALRVIDFPASLAARTPVELYTIYPSQDFIFKTDFSPDGRYLAAAGRDPLARILDAASGEPLFALMGMTSTILGIQFSPDGKYIRAASLDGTLHKHVVSTEDLIELAYSRLTRWWRPEECSLYLHQEQCPEPQQEVIRADYATSPAEFLGTWQTENVLANFFLRFTPDGRLVVAQTLADLDEAPLVVESYTMDGDILSMQDELCGDQVGQYRLRLVREPGQSVRLILVHTLDDCIPRRNGLTGSYAPIPP